MVTTYKELLNRADAGMALLRVLTDNSFDSVLITDSSQEEKIIYANEAFEQLTGHDPCSVIGKTPRILQGPGTDAKVISRLSVALKSGGTFEGKAINYKKDGTPFIMHWRVLPIKVGEEITGWVSIQRAGTVI
ncbi:MAG: PAS domain-containing protein [Alphaproteobacteria bacterium]|jgi:PAS domain S-box-containing protein|nr:PAS domain-containing protein [Alphaproteobacteria bacterium]